jgi:adenylate cyclase
MTLHWHLQILENRQQLFSCEEIDGPIELGRQSDKEAPPYGARKLRDRDHQDCDYWRVVVARLSEVAISRRHVWIEPTDDNRARVSNLSRTLTIRLSPNRELRPEESTEVDLPLVIALDRRTIRIAAVAERGSMLYSLANVSAAPGPAARPTLLASLVRPQAGNLELEGDQLVQWLQAAMEVLQAASGSADFYQKAARAVADLVDMDTGRVLLYQDGTWSEIASHVAGPPVAGEDPGPSSSILGRLLEDKRACWQLPRGASDIESLAGIAAVVAAPILDPQGQVRGALYGERRLQASSGQPHPVSRLEAMLVELLAGGVAAGLARVAQEQAAARARVQFEQFFTPELTTALAAQPDLLQGRDASVTLLFCDIRRFSAISARLGPQRTFAWIAAVMEVLSDCVLRYQGVVVDYIGDELMAMWGAPAAQAEHAPLACQAALAMSAALPRLNEQWQDELGGPMEVGVGINTGAARVGNTGSSRKFKYGPLGNTVNLASRVQGATKYLKTRLLITEETRRDLDETFAVRRVGAVRVVNISEPVTLYELTAPGQAGWLDLRTQYEQALSEFENQEFRTAARILGNLLTTHPGDGPSLVLMSRAVTALIEGTQPGHPVWDLPSK